MRLKKLDIKWGAAFEEAQPHSVQSESNDSGFQFYQDEDYGIIIELPRSATIRHSKDGFIIVIPN